MSFGRLLVRGFVGGFFVGHGTQKLFGWFGGPGLDGAAEGFEAIGLRPGRANALLAGTAEAAGGALVVLGAETPLAASVLTATMLTAVHRVHGKNGPWLAQGGYEYNAVLIAALLALVETGPGRPSVDHALGRERSGRGWAAATLAAGAAGSVGAYLWAKRYALVDSTSAPSDAVSGDGQGGEAGSEPAGQTSDQPRAGVDAA